MKEDKGKWLRDVRIELKIYEHHTDGIAIVKGDDGESTMIGVQAAILVLTNRDKVLDLITGKTVDLVQMVASTIECNDSGLPDIMTKAMIAISRARRLMEEEEGTLQ